jgi:hypothetical protein
VTRFAEVMYFCCLPIPNEEQPLPVAVVRLWSLPDANLLEESSNTYWRCLPGNLLDRVVVDVKAISTVIAMCPEQNASGQLDPSGYHFAVYKPGPGTLSNVFAELFGKDDENDED